MSTEDPNIGKQFVHRDPRNEGRTIEVLERIRPSQWGRRTQYAVENVAHPNPALVGRKSSVSEDTLKLSYRPVAEPVDPATERIRAASEHAYDEALAMVCSAYGIPNEGWPNPYAATVAVDA